MGESSEEVAESWNGFLARIQRFTDAMLDRLVQVSSGKDADDKETRMLGGVIQDSLNTWEKALHDASGLGRRPEAGPIRNRPSKARTGAD